LKKIKGPGTDPLTQEMRTMAIAQRTRPELLVHGTVQRTRRIESTKEGKTEYYGDALVIEAPGGGLEVTVWERDAPVGGFSAGDIVALVVTPRESSRGASLELVRVVTEADALALEAARA
jgi:hypothetical protein